MSTLRTTALAIIVFGFTVALSSGRLDAQQPRTTARPRPATQSPAATKPSASAPASTRIDLSATSANVSKPGTPVKIQILRWSTDEERAKIVAAFSAPPPPPARETPPASTEGAPARGDGAATGRAAGRGAGAPGGGAQPGAGRGAAGAQGAAGRAGGRGGRGRGEAAAPLTPIQRLEAAMTAAPTVGYIWTNDVTGYAIKYAYRAPAAEGGGERIVLGTDRRIGVYTNAWTPTGSVTPTDYDISIVELRVPAKGTGEGKTSLAAKIVVDSEAGTLALENYASAPAQLQNVKRQSGS
jgi:hypothetical protein